MTVIEAIDLAIEGQKYLLFKWGGEYGQAYPSELRASRQQEITKNMNELRELRGEVLQAR